MNRQDQVLIVSNQLDAHADGVIHTLTGKGVDVVRLNTEEVPLHVTTDLNFTDREWAGGLRIASNGRQIDAGRVRSIWWRRPVEPVLPDSLEPWEREFARAEIRHALLGFLDSLDCLWVSRPDAIARAKRKPAQLRRAAALGFDVPRTIITNDPDAARRFYSDCNGRVVFKVLTGPYLGLEKYQDRFPDAPLPEEDLRANTLLLGDAELSELETIRTVPSMFQEYVDKAYEYRVTVVGTEVYAAEIDSQSNPATKVDSRLDLENTLYRATELPPSIESLCVQLVRSQDLSYGAIDLIRTPDDRLVFLECNPNGQFGYIEELVPEFELTEAIANLLIEGQQE